SIVSHAGRRAKIRFHPFYNRRTPRLPCTSAPLGFYNRKCRRRRLILPNSFPLAGISYLNRHGIAVDRNRFIGDLPMLFDRVLRLFRRPVTVVAAMALIALAGCKKRE